MTNAPPAHGAWAEPANPATLPEPLRGLRAYLPDPMPVDPHLPTRTHRNLAETEHALGSLNESAERVADRSMLVLSGQIRDARSSGAMAGENADLVEALMFQLLSVRAAGDGTAMAELLDEHPIGRFILASAHGSARLAAGAPIGPALLGEISAILTRSDPRDLDTGLRQHQGWFGGRTVRDAYLLTVPPGEPLRAALAEWSAGIRADGPLSRVARIALAHLHLELIQPYPEANGHVARLFSSLEMVRTGLLRDQILPMSCWLDTHYREYHERIRAVVHGGPLHEWIDFFATGLRRTALAQVGLIGELDALRRSHLALAPRPPSLHRVAGDLVTSPMLTHRTLVDRYGITVKTATHVTRQLVDLGILTSLEDRVYNKVFVCRPVIRLLTTERPVAESARDDDAF
ncbi:Fic family protein [Saccharothrix tamanrassetensis]|uniref:Fic family protein n=1 Tax=Saccharothrix tamanrassetensis TaxID=1051531 RepID=A0A841CB97_9PSEU|nr:hypothetical protein [Saccharothrix tamanrassetensis]MBB5953624.1 Fic family protein [Saccharothrix tamanrassetensis]